MTAGYHVRVSGIGRTVETVKLDEDADWQAVSVAFGASSPFGHSLWKGRRFLGYFDPDPMGYADAFDDRAPRGASR